MKKILGIFIGLFIFLFSTQIASAAETIDDYRVDIDIKKDSSVRVIEDIRYNFGSSNRHGIYRDIPLSFDTDYGEKNIEISDVEVLDANGNKRQFQTSKNGNDFRIKIGDPNKKISGVNTYEIHYTVDWALRYFQDYDELYWNSIGTEWKVPISQANVTINLPKELNKNKVEYNCYKGKLGERNDCGSVQAVKSGNKISSVKFSGNSLGNGVGMTTVVTFPKGIVSEPTMWQRIKKILKDNWVLGLPLVVFLVMYFVWRKFGKDPEGKGNVIAQYEPPEGLTPVEVGMLEDQKIHKKDLSAQIIDLARRGFLEIEYKNEEGILFDDKKFVLKKKKDPLEAKNSFDQKILYLLFGSSETVELGDLESKKDELRDIKEDISKKLTDAGYYRSNPRKIRSMFIVLAFFIGFSSFFFGSVLAIGSIVASAVIIGLFGYIMPSKTKEGAVLREKILGFREYLSVAEKDRLEFHNAPERKPETFEKFLPYAIAFGVEKEWAKEFSDIYDTQPSWYTSHTGTYSSVALANEMSSFDSAVGSTALDTSSGSSGISGGSAGGGAGGGGGGSW